MPEWRWYYDMYGSDDLPGFELPFVPYYDNEVALNMLTHFRLIDNDSVMADGTEVDTYVFA